MKCESKIKILLWVSVRQVFFKSLIFITKSCIEFLRKRDGPVCNKDDLGGHRQVQHLAFVKVGFYKGKMIFSYKRSIPKFLPTQTDKLNVGFIFLIKGDDGIMIFHTGRALWLDQDEQDLFVWIHEITIDDSSFL